MVKKLLGAFLVLLFLLAPVAPTVLANGEYIFQGPESISHNGIIASVSFDLESPQQSDTDITATVTLSGTADETAVHKVKLQSASLGMNSDELCVFAREGQTFYSTTSPYAVIQFNLQSDVTDFQLSHTCVTPGDGAGQYFGALGDASIIYTNTSIAGVSSGPSVDTTFIVFVPHLITAIHTYHWEAQSTDYLDQAISLRHEDGTLYGPWPVSVADGQGNKPNVNWYVFPNEVVKAGSYTLIDSDNSTWSWASDTNNKGICVVKGIYPTVTDLVIGDALAPKNGETPHGLIVGTDQYSGTVSWSPDHNIAEANRDYTATITLTAKDGYTFDGVAENAFVVSSAKSTENAANSGVITATFKSPPLGYYTDGNGVMAYRYYDSNLDIMGFHYDGWKQTTCGNWGYRTELSIDGAGRVVVSADGTPVSVGTSGLSLQIVPHFVSGGKALQVRYTFVNSGDEAVTFSFGSHADIQIGSDDSAPISVFDDSIPVEDNRGFKMVSRSGDDGYAQFNFFGKRSAGVTDVDTFWYGYWSERQANIFNQVTITSYSSDSGMAYSWQDRVIGPGETQLYSVVIGIGGAESADILGFAVSYHDNVPDAAISVPETQAKIENVVLELSSDVPVRSGYTFTEWNTEPDGTGTSYQPGDIYTVNAELALYAQWQKMDDPQPQYTGPYVHYRIIAAAGVGGSITPSGNVMVGEWANQEFVFTPETGYTISDVLVDGESIGAVTSYVFKNVAAGHSIEAVFDIVAFVPFQDVKENDWFFDAVWYVHRNGLMTGTGGSTFEPNGPATRAMIPTILHRLEGSPTTAAHSGFTDLGAGEWYSNGVVWSAENNIILGISQDKFAPDANITREELAAMLYRYAAYKGLVTDTTENLSGFVDGDKVSSWALDAMKWAVGAGLIQGKGEGVLDPQGLALRSQIAAIFQRFLK